MPSIPQTMTVPHFVGQRRVERIEKPVPEPGAGQLLIRARSNALCGSERPQFINGSDVTPGHEAAGVVVAAGLGARTAVGTPGVVFLMDYCGECRSCRRGFTNLCAAKRGDMGFNRDGGYGVYELVNENIFFPVDVDLPLTEATMLLDIMGTGGHAIKRARLVHHDIESVLVAGAGPIGLGVLAMAKLLLGESTPVYIFDVIDYRLALAERMGGTPISVANGASLEEGLKAHAMNRFDLAIDTTGKQAARQQALNALAARGVLILVGHGEGLQLNVSADMIAPERSVLGSEYFAYTELQESLPLLRANRSYMTQIITHRFGVSDIQTAFETFLAGDTGKVVIEQ
ncbi:MAG TPA: alcohol dehydrogenase catalytic domain-containing protein [Armatimonadota bacterium]|nr:alcohol dehydrogenase catalytic domain-containing protein [Armatimonadota bacterium]